METADVSSSPVPAPQIVLASTFTVDPLAEPLSFLMGEVGLDFAVALAPYGQLFQELLDPGRQFGRNQRGVNVLCLRFEDWWRDAAGTAAETAAQTAVERTGRDLVAAIRKFAGESSSTLLVAVCPPSPTALESAESAATLRSLRETLTSGVLGLPNVTVLQEAVLADDDAAAVHDAGGDRLGHLPYTPLYFAALAQTIARAIHALKIPPHKVLALDCDNTLWKGVVGEDGVDGIEITPRHAALQRFLLAKKDAGMVLCLVSKNVEADVRAVFAKRNEMILSLDDLVAMRVNWSPKSENIRSLAAELNLGTDSFVLIDDSPLECAEVEANCRGPLTLQLGADDDPDRFLSNVWLLDQTTVTEADRRRTEMYRENRERDRYRDSATNLGEFLSGLELRVELAEPLEEQWPRVSQLTHRTNQFNFTTRRRSEAEVRGLAAEGLRCLLVQVRDRFGDYGIVGVVIFSAAAEELVIDTFLLSCRVLGRGVEHAMFRHLAAVAGDLGAQRIVAPYLATAKNIPARQFLESLAADREVSDGGDRFVLSIERAAALAPGAVSPYGDLAAEKPVAPAPAAPASGEGSEALSKSARWNRLARELTEPNQILAALASHRLRARVATGDAAGPRTEAERRLVAIWRDVLGLRDVGVRDDYFEIGGSSLEAVMICVAIEREFGKSLPLSAVVDCPTIEQLATRLESGGVETAVRSIVPLSTGGSGTPLFLLHDGDGEVLLYRNLARRLAGRRPVYAVQPVGRKNARLVQTRIEDMAAHYIREIRKVCAHGPYFLGGLCAAGTLSFEMALQLEAAGEEARLVAVFDAADVQASLRKNRVTHRRAGRFREALSAASPREIPGVVFRKARGFLTYELSSRARGAVDRLSVATLGLCLRYNLPLPALVRRLSVRTIFSFAEGRYRPRGKIRREILLFRATEGEGSDEPFIRIYEDPLLGWAERTNERVQVVEVAGGHSSMLQEPNVIGLAQHLAHYLDEQERERYAPSLVV